MGERGAHRPFHAFEPPAILGVRRLAILQVQREVVEGHAERGHRVGQSVEERHDALGRQVHGVAFPYDQRTCVRVEAELGEVAWDVSLEVVGEERGWLHEPAPLQDHAFEFENGLLVDFEEGDIRAAVPVGTHVEAAAEQLSLP